MNRMGSPVLGVVFSCMIALTCCAADPDLAEVGEDCTDSSDCYNDASCFNRVSGGPVCMALCSAGDRLCSDGSVCLASATNSEHVCYIGGTTAIGSACTGGTECAIGGVCINDGTDTLCRQACSTDDGSACAAGETCEPTTSPPEGFCL